MSADIIKWPDRGRKPFSEEFAQAATPAAEIYQELSRGTAATYIPHLLHEAETLNGLLIDLEQLLLDDDARRALHAVREALMAMISRARQTLDRLDGKAVS